MCELFKLNIFEKQVFDLKYNELGIGEFEQWVYDTSELENLLTPDDYLLLISINYKSKHARVEIEKIIDNYIDYSKFETLKVIDLLNKALSKDEDLGNILRQFYDMYCNGYYFFEDLGLGYGLSCEVPLKYANSWEELNQEQKKEILNGFYPQVESDIKRAVDWINNKKIVLTGAKNDMERWEYIDNRTPDEKKSTVWSEVKSSPEISVKKSRLDCNKQKNWWGFWKKSN